MRLLLFVFKAFASTFIAFNWCHINPGKSYDWLDGLWHGFNVYGNIILSVFSKTIIKSPNGTIGYNASWWIIVSVLVLMLILTILHWCGVIKLNNKSY